MDKHTLHAFDAVTGKAAWHFLAGGRVDSPPTYWKGRVFFGGKDYLPLFCDLTKDVKAKRTVFYNSGYAPAAQGCALVRFVTTTRTNWHYECARNFNGDLPKRAATVRLADEARRAAANDDLRLSGHSDSPLAAAGGPSA